jgi:hypothetical protein
MHGEVDRAGRQGNIELLGEEALAAGLAERAVRDQIPAGLDDVDLDVAPRLAMRGGEPRCDLA